MLNQNAHANEATSNGTLPRAISLISLNSRVLAFALLLTTLTLVFTFLLMGHAGDPTWPGPVATHFVLAHAL